MGLFKQFYRAVSPKILIKRQRMFIEKLLCLDPNFQVIEISDEEVLLKLPKSEEGEEILIVLKQEYNSINPIQRKTLYIDYVSIVEGELLEVNFNFEDPTASMVMLNEILEKVRLKLQEVKTQKNLNLEENNAFVANWKLLDFHKQYGKMQIASFIDEQFNVPYKMCVFTKEDESKIYVYFDSKLGELTPKEISSRKNELYVGKVQNGNYFLYAKENKEWNIEEDSLEDIKENCNALYDANDKEREIERLTIEQKIALFVVMTIFAGLVVQENEKDNAADTVKEFANVLHLYDKYFDEYTFKRISFNKQECINIIKTINMDCPFIEFIIACGFLRDISKDDLFFSYKFIHLLIDMGFTEEDAKDINKGKYNYRFY